MHREVTMKLDSELQSMIANCNELDHQLRESKLKIRLERDTVNKHSMAFQKFANPNKDKALTGRQLAICLQPVLIKIYIFKIFAQLLYKIIVAGIF